jgi:hypothetical protein
MPPALQTSALDCTIAEAIARELQTNACLKDFTHVTSMELAGVIDRLMQTYARWTSGDQGQVAECSRYFANLCFRLSIPMVEAAYALFLIRDGLLATISSENEKGRGARYPQLTEFFNVVTLDLLVRC